VDFRFQIFYFFHQNVLLANARLLKTKLTPEEKLTNFCDPLIEEKLDDLRFLYEFVDRMFDADVDLIFVAAADHFLFGDQAREDVFRAFEQLVEDVAWAIRRWRGLLRRHRLVLRDRRLVGHVMRIARRRLLVRARHLVLRCRHRVWLAHSLRNRLVLVHLCLNLRLLALILKPKS